VTVLLSPAPLLPRPHSPAPLLPRSPVLSLPAVNPSPRRQRLRRRVGWRRFRILARRNRRPAFGAALAGPVCAKVVAAFQAKPVQATIAVTSPADDGTDHRARQEQKDRPIRTCRSHYHACRPRITAAAALVAKAPFGEPIFATFANSIRVTTELKPRRTVLPQPISIITGRAKHVQGVISHIDPPRTA